MNTIHTFKTGGINGPPILFECLFVAPLTHVTSSRLDKVTGKREKSSLQWIKYVN